MERVLWPEGDALSRCLYIRGGACSRVVGVVSNVSLGALVEEPWMMYYVPFSERVGQVPNAFVVRMARPGQDPSSVLRAALRGVSSNVRFVNVRGYREILEPTVRSWRLGATVLTAFGVLALLVAAVGLYSTLAFEVAQRQHELGIRSALGASASRLVSVVVMQPLGALTLGSLAGAALAFAGARGLQGLLFGVSGADPGAYASAGATLLLIAFLAATGPARRAVRADPIVALRSQ